MNFMIDDDITQPLRTISANMILSKKMFSLVELLVVVCIFAVLASLLNPSLRSAMASAGSLHCLNQQKGVYQMTQFHLEDHDQTLIMQYNNGEHVPGPYNYGTAGIALMDSGVLMNPYVDDIKTSDLELIACPESTLADFADLSDKKKTFLAIFQHMYTLNVNGMQFSNSSVGIERSNSGEIAKLLRTADVTDPSRYVMISDTKHTGTALLNDWMLPDKVDSLLWTAHHRGERVSVSLLDGQAQAMDIVDVLELIHRDMNFAFQPED